MTCRGLSRQTQADRPGAAVQIQHLIRRRVDGVFHRTLIQPLGLHGIDLIESLRRECERQPAEPVGQLRLSPERIEISREHNVAFLLVDIEHDAGQLRAVLAQVGDQVVRLRAEPTCGDDAQYGVWRVHGAAREQMPHRAAAGGFVIRRNAAQIHPVADRLRRLVSERELEQALLHGRDVMAGRAVKALDHAAVFRADGVDRLVPVTERIFHTDDVLYRHRNAADARERIVDAPGASCAAARRSPYCCRLQPPQVR